MVEQEMAHAWTEKGLSLEFMRAMILMAADPEVRGCRAGGAWEVGMLPCMQLRGV
jgi:hypothetical protein